MDSLQRELRQAQDQYQSLNSKIDPLIDQARQIKEQAEAAELRSHDEDEVSFYGVNEIFIFNRTLLNTWQKQTI